MNTYPNAPYRDDYDPTKGYVQILAVPGNAEQAREFTQLGTMNRDFLGRLGDSMYKNGTIIDGCTLVINDNRVIISSGRIYLDGLVRLVDGGEILIAGIGSEVIGAKIVSSIVTENEDPTLRDPAQEWENYGEAGAHRVKEVVKFTLNDDASSVLYRLEEGKLVTSGSGESTSTITETIARRTYDENGNYKVNGLELRDRGESRDGKVLISLTDGKAYIQGYEINKPASSTVSLNYSQSTREIVNEPKVYNTGTNTYKINNQPVKQLTNVVSIIEVTESITRGNIQGGIDYLSHTPVVSVDKVNQSGTVYESGVDYQLTNDGIDWSLSGKAPSIGTSYTVTYKYNKVLVVGVDIELVIDEHTGEGSLKFLSSGAKPVNSSTFTIDYQFYLARKDMICLNKQGAINVLEGKPDIARLVESPLNQDDTQLIIGTVLVLPNSSKVEIANFNTTRLSQSDLYNMYVRINDLEYNQAISDLDQEAIDGESATELKGIYTDGFVGLTKSDTTHKDYDCTIDLDNAELTLPVTTSITNVGINTNTYETNISKIGRVVMAPFVHKLALSQAYATGSMLVNPYAVYNPMSLVNLTPSVDNWIDTDKIVVNSQKTTSTTLRRWWYHRGESWAEEEKKKWEALGYSDGGASLGWNSATASSTSVSSDVVLSEAIMYMRQIPVQVSASNFTANVDNIECYFNDTRVPLTATGTTKAGTSPGTVRADGKGMFTAQFTVPPNVPCGSVDVVLKSATGQGSAVYQAQGRRQVIQDTVLTTTTIVTPVDPLAQSFAFDTDTVLTKAELFFASKDESKAVVVQVRNMVNGYPGTTCYTAVTVPSASITASSTGTVATEVVFNQPVYCKANEQYCICILSDSNLYSLFTAELGKKDLNRGTYVTSQPYNTGVLFSSSNALTWTAHQTMDLKFNLYKAEYTGNGQIVFNDVTGVTMSRLVLAAQSIDYKNAGIEWFYKVSDASSWLPLETYVDRDLSAKTSTIKLKAVLNVKYSTSPILAGDCINLISFLEKSKGAYVSRAVTMESSFNKLRVSMQVSKPSGTEVTVYYATDKESEWVKLTEGPSITAINNEFSRYEWSKTITSAKSYRIKVDLETSNPLVKPRVKKLISILKQ